MAGEYHNPSDCRRCDAAEAAAQMLNDRGIPVVYDPWDTSIRLDDDGCIWYFGTVNETWGADIIADPTSYDGIGAAYTTVPSESEDPFAIADAIEAAVMRREGVRIWAQDDEATP